MVHADKVARLQRQAIDGQRAQRFRHGLERNLFPTHDRSCEPVVGRRGVVQDAVDDERLSAEPDGCEFVARARHLAQC